MWHLKVRLQGLTWGAGVLIVTTHTATFEEKSLNDTEATVLVAFKV